MIDAFDAASELAMISDLKKLVVVQVAMILFLRAASTSPGLTWRANPAQQILATR